MSLQECQTLAPVATDFIAWSISQWLIECLLNGFFIFNYNPLCLACHNGPTFALADNLKPYFRKLCILYCLNLQSPTQCWCSDNKRQSNRMDFCICVNECVSKYLFAANWLVHGGHRWWTRYAKRPSLWRFICLLNWTCFQVPLWSWWKQTQIEVPLANDPKLDRCIEVHSPSSQPTISPLLIPSTLSNLKVKEVLTGAHWKVEMTVNFSASLSLAPPWDGRSCYSSQDERGSGQQAGVRLLMIEEKRSKFILLSALCQVPVAYRWEPVTHHHVTTSEVSGEP